MKSPTFTVSGLPVVSPLIIIFRGIPGAFSQPQSSYLGQNMQYKKEFHRLGRDREIRSRPSRPGTDKEK
jgi:hypothetical protein